MTKAIAMALLLAAAPLAAHEEGTMEAASGSAKPMMHDGMMKGASGTAKPMMMEKMQTMDKAKLGEMKKKQKMKKGAKAVDAAGTTAAAGAKGAAPKAEAKHEDWTCTMHPEVHSDHPGKCPKCGMDLVLATEGQAKHDDMNAEKK